MEQVEVGIVGAGLAGLSCARRLAEQGVPFALFESADRVGGRVATDEENGFLLDRGFQVLLDSYPEARKSLDMDALEARPFLPGVLVRKGGRFWRVVDPWRAPLLGLATLRAPFVKWTDPVRMASLRRRALKSGGKRDARTTAEWLRAHGFSEAMRESFFRPFFGGVTLDPDLGVPAWYFLSLFGWFAAGSAVLPAAGMQAIPMQLAAKLPEGSVRLKQKVASVSPDSIELDSGERIACRAVVVATDASTAGRLLSSEEASGWLGTTTIYYSAERSPVDEPILVLNGEGPSDGPVNHLCVLSDAQPAYAPPGSALISVTLLDLPSAKDTGLDDAVRAQLSRWYGGQVHDWRLLRVDRIAQALPRMNGEPRPERRAGEVYVCGDHVATPSIQGSLESGIGTADAVSAELAAVHS